MLDLSNVSLRAFQREGNMFVFLLRNPFKKSILEKYNPLSYKFFTLWELKDSGLFIGYIIELKEDYEDIVYSTNFIFIGNSTITDKVNNLLKNEHIQVFEDSLAQSCLIIGGIDKDVEHLGR